ncbi:MAG: GNAT family N-acetyltransferase [Rhizorhabdus sp.]|uniref:GNAT family N-acetyltransferase n=1 Tax=Rhizorhabdus sp. TaxID=1968843 RepID=UPI001B649F99|nr:GNAT family N-acetyltransferase [Rhizorhabdus sp.]MBP8232662.1 GNAT family N-acetyltransferase [Rhizorhabdus sp.]
MIGTERLILRGWRDEDAAPFLAMGQDPEVMAYLGPLQTADDVAAAIARQRDLLEAIDHCFWALEERASGAFIGFCGLKPGAAGTPVEGRTEIGWRLAREHWGKGYAREAAQTSLDWGWAHGVDSIWAITVPANVRSWGLMERLGMTRRPDLDFDHPLPGLEERLKAHVTYSIERPR